MTVVEGPGSEKVTESGRWVGEKTNRLKRFTNYISITPSNRERLHRDVKPLRWHHPSRVEKDRPINLCKTFQPIRVFCREISKGCTGTSFHSHSITNCPSSPNVCPSFGKIPNHSCVHSFEPSDHRPVHSDIPHGFRTTTNLFSLHSTARRTEYAWFPIRPCTLTPWTPLLVVSRLLNEHPKSRSLFALLSSSSQNRSVSRMSYNLLCLQNSLYGREGYVIKKYTLLCKTVETPLEDKEMGTWFLDMTKTNQDLPSEVLNRITFLSSQQMRVVAM